MANRKEFGRLLRRLRTGAERSMGQLARHLDISVSFLSDVERGIRAPLMNERIEEAAGYLGVDSTELLDAAARSRGVFELKVNVGGDDARRVGAALMRGWPLDEDKIERIRKIIEE